MRHRLTVPAACGMVLGMALVAGCGNAHSGGSANGGTAAKLTPPAIPASPTPPAADGSDIQLPLDAFTAETAQETQALKRAVQILVQRCMSTRGFSYAPTPAGQDDTSAGPQARMEVYGITDLTQAQRLGYARAGQNTANAASGGAGGLPMLNDLLAQHGNAWVVAMFGAVPPATPGPGQPAGCVNAGPAKLYDDAYGKVDRSIVGELADQASSQTQADARVLAVERAWSGCMSGRGFQFGNPMQAAARQWPTPPSADEIATAVADVTCKQNVNLPGVWLAVEAGYQRELIERNAAALTDFQQAHQNLVRTAMQIAASAPASPAA